MSDSGEKTEEATPRALKKARERGEVSQSKDLTGSVLLAVAALVLSSQVDSAGTQIGAFSRAIFSAAARSQWSPEALRRDWAHPRGAVLDGDRRARFLLPALAVLQEPPHDARAGEAGIQGAGRQPRGQAPAQAPAPGDGDPVDAAQGEKGERHRDQP